MNVVVNWGDIKRSPTIRTKLKDKKSILQFLPESLEYISTKKIIIYKGEKLKTSYLIDIANNLILKYYFKKDNHFNLSSTVLKSKYGYLYNYYINYLVETSNIRMVLNYKKGTRSRIYSLNSSILSNRITRYHNSDSVILKKYRNKFAQVEEEIPSKVSFIDNDIKVKLVSDLFNVAIEFDKSIFFLDGLKKEDCDIYNRNRYSVECIDNKHIFYHFDNYGRLHTNFTILKSYIRKNCLLIDGEETCELDIKNSQPLFLTKIIEYSGTKWVNDDELSLFKYLTMSGKYYDYLIQNLKLPNKKAAKELTYKVLFGRNPKNSKVDIMFSKIFPTIHYFLTLYKKDAGDYRVLSHELQKAESNLVFNKIIRNIMDNHPHISIVTVHDSIIFPNKYRNEVTSIFNLKLYEEFGII